MNVIIHVKEDGLPSDVEQEFNRLRARFWREQSEKARQAAAERKVRRVTSAGLPLAIRSVPRELLETGGAEAVRPADGRA